MFPGFNDNDWDFIELVIFKDLRFCGWAWMSEKSLGVILACLKWSKNGEGSSSIQLIETIFDGNIAMAECVCMLMYVSGLMNYGSLVITEKGEKLLQILQEVNLSDMME